MNEILKVNPVNEIEEIDGYLYLMDNKNNKVYIFNEFEKKLISYFDEKKSVDEISTILAKEYKFYNKEEFLFFVHDLMEKELLISI